MKMRIKFRDAIQAMTVGQYMSMSTGIEVWGSEGTLDAVAVHLTPSPSVEFHVDVKVADAEDEPEEQAAPASSPSAEAS